MGGLLGKERDIWITIYEKGIKDADKVQKQALKLTIEGKLSGTGEGVMRAEMLRAQQQIQHAHSSPSGGNKSQTSSGNSHITPGPTGNFPWSASSAPTPTSAEKFQAITSYVEEHWTEKDKKELRSYAKKLWKRYHKSKEPHLLTEELLELTKDSLTTLKSHISLFIHHSYEEMKKHTQVCMINLLQRCRYQSLGSSSAASTPKQSEPVSNLSGANASSPTINVNDIEWLNEQVEAEKKNVMQILNAQIDEWIEHYVDVADAIQAKIKSMVKQPAANSSKPPQPIKILRKDFADHFGMAIYEVVGPQFFSQYLRQPAAEESKVQEEEDEEFQVQ